MPLAGIRSLTLASDISVLSVDAVVERRDRYLLVRTPGNPSFYFGNFLAFAEAPRPGDGERWEALFDAEFADDPRVRHRAFTWDRTDGNAGSAHEEFARRGYVLEESYALTAALEELRPHPRENRVVRVEPLDPENPVAAGRWAEVLEIQVAGRDPIHDEPGYRDFATARLGDLQAVFRASGGTWYVAVDPETDAAVASLGIVVRDGVGRFQLVDTAEAYRRQGICSRLVVDAARHSAATFGAERFVIVADAAYHALGLYESLGFARAEHTFAVWRRLDETPPAT